MLTIEQVQAAFNDPEMEVRQHPPNEMRTLLMFCSLPFVGGRTWACHADERVWMGFTEQEALREAMKDAPK